MEKALSAAADEGWRKLEVPHSTENSFSGSRAVRELQPLSSLVSPIYPWLALELLQPHQLHQESNKSPD